MLYTQVLLSHHNNLDNSFNKGELGGLGGI